MSLAVVLAAAAAGTSTAAARPPAVRIAEPGPLALDERNGLLVGDRRLNRIVRIDLSTGRRRVVASGLRELLGLAFDDMGRLYVCAGQRIYRLEGRRRIVVAGTGRRGHSGDGGPATAARLGGPFGFQVDHDKSVVFAEYDNRVRVVDPDGTIRTIAGTGEAGYAGDGGPARSALLSAPHDLALRADREVIVADSHNAVLRRIDPSGRISTFATGFFAPVAVEGGPGNTLYVADGRLNAVFRLSPDGRSRRRVARASGPIYLAIDVRHNVYVSELVGDQRVLRIAPNGRVRVLVR